MNKSIRFVSVLAFGAMAVASQAVAVFISAQSATGNTPPVNYNSTVNSTFGSSNPFNLIPVGSTAVISMTGTTGSTAKYTVDAASSITFTFNSAADNTGNGTLSFSSAATVLAATGVFAPFLGAGGLTASSTTQLTPPGSNNFTIAGNLTPEPASFAALGVGALALLRRRRKA